METLPVLSITLFPGGGYRVSAEETAAFSEAGALRVVRVSYPRAKDLKGFTVLNGSVLFAWIASSPFRERAMEALRDYYESIGVMMLDESVNDDEEMGWYEAAERGRGKSGSNGRGDAAFGGVLGGALIGGALAGPGGALGGALVGGALSSSMVHHHSRADAAFISS